MQRLTAALEEWRDAQAKAIEAEARLSRALEEELAGGAQTPQELLLAVKRARAFADGRLATALAVIGGVAT